MAYRLRIHAENQSALPEMFHITSERYAAVARRHPALADRIEFHIGWDGDGFEASLAEADALVGWRFPLGSLRCARRLRLIQLTGAGTDHLQPLDWLEPGVILANNSGVHAERVGEYVVMAVLALNARLPFYADCRVRRQWQPVFMPGVRGKTVLVVGVGGLGQAAAERCRRLGMRVIGVRASGEPLACVDRMVSPAGMAEVLGEADFVVLSVPATPASRAMFGHMQLRALKPGCGLINLARADVLDVHALEACLRDGHLSGAFLDVVDPEPLPSESRYWDLPNTLITPHVSCDDPDNYITDSLEILFDNVQRLLDGASLRNVVDPARGY